MDLTPSLFRSARGIVTTLMTAVLLGGCHKSTETKPPETRAPIAVAVVSAKQVARPSVEEVVGTVRAKLHAAIEAKVSARIESLLVAPGQAVKAGELIAKLDAKEMQAKLDQALALREQATQDLTRYSSLINSKITTQAEFDAVQARERVAVAAVREIETMLGYTNVVAPFSGVITRKLADVGDLAAPGRSIIEMEDPGALRFETDIPESLISSVKLGTVCPVRLGNSPQTLEGRVVEIAPVADAASRTFLVKLDLPPSEGARSGQFGRVAIATGETRSINVPASAIVARGQMESVFIVADKRAQLRLVRTGKRTANEVELLAGISPGESVVTEGADQLHDGQPITLKP